MRINFRISIWKITRSKFANVASLADVVQYLGRDEKPSGVFHLRKPPFLRKFPPIEYKNLLRGVFLISPKPAAGEKKWGIYYFL